ncbi:hypothetical protein Y1Q_0013668 [Alligator mississippiensis]|uniref:Uncharacterized protein n=1 Tax=Alligator mississippiensis TaxID=8496 RepID=A0A151P3P5_ALLMI|nr:hypothetical protein Y1Q_0013668 [Alligator mississippiensis]
MESCSPGPQQEFFITKEDNKSVRHLIHIKQELPMSNLLQDMKRTHWQSCFTECFRQLGSHVPSSVWCCQALKCILQGLPGLIQCME